LTITQRTEMILINSCSYLVPPSKSQID